MQSIVQLIADLRLGVRSLWRRPHATIAAILVASLGIGCALSVLAFAYRVYLAPMPFPDAHRVVNVFRQTPELDQGPISVLEFEDLVERERTFEHLALIQSVPIGYQPEGESSTQLNGMLASWPLLRILGIDVLRGRDLGPDDDRPGAERVALVSEAFWQTHFAGAADMLGTAIPLDGNLTTIVGVLPAGIDRATLAGQTPIGDIVMPISLTLNRQTNPERAERLGTVAVGRIAEDVAFAAARADMRRIGEELRSEFPATNKTSAMVVSRLRDTIMQGVKPYLLALCAATVLILIATVANLGNLSLASTLVRRREIATRQALGAPRSTVTRHILAESAVIGIAGAILGALVAVASARLIGRLMPRTIADGFEALSGPILLAMAPLIVGVVVAMSIPSILFVTGPGALRMVGATRGGGDDTRGGRRLRAWMVIAEVAIAAALLIGAGLLSSSLSAMLRVDPGFRPERLTEFSLLPDPEDGAHFERRLTFIDTLLSRVRAIPGIEGAAISSAQALNPGGTSGSRLAANDRPHPPLSDMEITFYVTVTSDYFEVMGVDLLQGRVFDPGLDAVDSEPPSAIINESIARMYWPGDAEDPTGKEVIFELIGSPESYTTRARTVVGVVEDVLLDGIAVPASNTVFVPLRQPPTYESDNPGPQLLYLIIRSALTTEAVARETRRILNELAPGSALFGLRDMVQVVADATAPERHLGRLIRALAILAVILAAVGIYGVTATAVVAERRDIGVRAALGADPPRLVRIYLRRAVRVAALGVAIGLGAALVIMPRVMDSVLFGIEARTPLPYLISVGILGLASIGAAMIPALRATKVPPTEVLRDVS